jgi:hypothetical protein
MRIKLSLIVACLAVASLCSAADKPTLQTYTNAEQHFKIQHLSTWKTEEPKNTPDMKPWIIVRFVHADANVQSRAVVAMPPLDGHKAGEAIKLDDIATAVVDHMKPEMPDASIVIATDTKLGNEPARKMILTGHGKKDNAEMKLLVVAAAHKDKPYVVGIMATKDQWEKSKDGFDLLIETFGFTE